MKSDLEQPGQPRRREQNELAISAREQQRLGGVSSAERLHSFALELSQWNGLHDCTPPIYVAVLTGRGRKTPPF